MVTHVVARHRETLQKVRPSTYDMMAVILESGLLARFYEELQEAGVSGFQDGS